MDMALGPSKPSAASVKTLPNAFLFDLEGHSVIALKLASKVAKQVSGQEIKTSGGIISKLKAKLGLIPEAERWFVISSVDNPLLREIAKFGPLVAEQITKASGTTVTEADLAISASVPVSGVGEKDEPTISARDGRGQIATQSITH